MIFAWLLAALLAFAPPPPAQSPDGPADVHVRIAGAQSGTAAVVSTTAEEDQPWLEGLDKASDPSRYVCANIDSLPTPAQTFSGDNTDLSFDVGSILPVFQGLEIVEDHGERVVMVLVCARMSDGSQRGFAVTDIASPSAVMTINMNAAYERSAPVYVFGREH